MSEQQSHTSELDSLLADLGAAGEEFPSESNAASDQGAATTAESVTRSIEAMTIVGLSEAAERPGRVETLSVPVAPAPPTPTPATSLAEAIAAMEVAATDVAESRESDRVATTGESLLLCMVGPTRYGVPVGRIVEVTRVPHTTRVPHAPDWVRGVTNLRGDVLSVVDVRALANVKADRDGRMMVARLSDGFAVALIVDEVSRIVSVPRAAITAPTAVLQGRLAPFVRGVCEVDDRSVAVLDLEGLLESAEIRLFDGAIEARLTA